MSIFAIKKKLKKKKISFWHSTHGNKKRKKIVFGTQRLKCELLFSSSRCIRVWQYKSRVTEEKPQVKTRDTGNQSVYGRRAHLKSTQQVAFLYTKLFVKKKRLFIFPPPPSSPSLRERLLPMNVSQRRNGDVIPLNVDRGGSCDHKRRLLIGCHLARRE